MVDPIAKHQNLQSIENRDSFLIVVLPTLDLINCKVLLIAVVTPLNVSGERVVLDPNTDDQTPLQNNSILSAHSISIAPV
jgi:hypothetical protein